MAERERYATPKELADDLAHLGIRGLDERACQNLVRCMRADGARVLLGRQVRASDAESWLLAHPTWRPFSNKATEPGLFVEQG